MSDWATIESDVVDVLVGLSVEEEPLLATVAARTARERKKYAEAIKAERLSAAHVMLTGRDADGDEPGRAQLSVVLATRSLRDDDEARVDGSDVRGMWTVAQAVSGALHGREVGQWRLSLVDERPAGGEEGTIVWEQRYEVARALGVNAPTFDGVALAGASSEMTVEVGTLGRASESFTFPGVDGVFERFLGVRDRSIVWRGRLRAANDAAMNEIEANIEDEIRSGKCARMVDSWGRLFESCVVKELRRRGSRTCDELAGEVVQDVEIELRQLAE